MSPGAGTRGTCQPLSRDSGQMPVQEQGLWASLLELTPEAGHRALWDLENHQWFLQSWLLPLEYRTPPFLNIQLNMSIYFFCLTVSQIQQALRRLKKAIISVLWTSSSPCWHHHLPWNAYSSCGRCISPLSPHLDFSVCGILQTSHGYSARLLLSFLLHATLGRRSWGHRRAFYPPESILYLAVRLPLRSCHS